MARFKTSPIPARYKELARKRLPYINRGSTYAQWTLPHVFPESFANENPGDETAGTQDTANSWQSVGARLVNHLANKYMIGLFQPGRPFLRLDVPDRVFAALEKQTGDTRSEIEFAFARMEREAGITEFEKIFARAALLEAMKLLIITGNALVFIPPKGRLQTYSLYDYVVLRDASGEILEIITVDYKDRTTLSEELRVALDKEKPNQKKKSATYKVYTRIRLKNKGGEKRYHVMQSLDDFAIKAESWVKPEKMRWFPLTWTRSRREHYGRGLVEEYRGDFHALDILSMALTEGTIAASDIKYLVDPNSGIDVYELTKSDSGSYHYGEKDSVKQIDVSNSRVWEFLMTRVDHFERNLGKAFLLNTSAQRDAERVTAQEVRIVAQELETSHGGAYSTFAMELQYPLAYHLLSRVDDGDLGRYDVRPIVLTGLEALGRAADLDALTRWLETLGLLNSIPEDMRAEFSGRDFAVATATGFGVDYSAFIPTREEAVEAQAAAMRQNMGTAMAQGGIDGMSKMLGNLDPETAQKLLAEMQKNPQMAAMMPQAQ